MVSPANMLHHRPLFNTLPNPRRASPTPNGPFREALGNQLRIIGSLLLRETSSRFGRENIGFLWFVGEPMMLATVIMLVHIAEPSSRFTSDVSPAPFAIIGYTLFIIFRGIFNRAEGAIESNQSLLYHRMISLFDIVTARAMVDAIGCFVTMVVLLTIIHLIGLAALPVRPMYLLGAVALMIWWSWSFAMIAAAVSYRNETVGRQLHVISYFSIPISGAFYQMSWVPAAWRNILQWFPMALIMEQGRYGMFRSAEVDYVDPWYVSAWCAVLTYVGLVSLRRLRRRVSH